MSFVGPRGEPNSRYHVYQVLGHALTSVRSHLWLFGVGPDNSVLREVEFFFTFRDPCLIMLTESKRVFQTVSAKKMNLMTLFNRKCENFLLNTQEKQLILGYQLFILLPERISCCCLFF